MGNNMQPLEVSVKNLKAQTEAIEQQLAFEHRMMSLGYKKGKLGKKQYWFNSKDVPIFTEDAHRVDDGTLILLPAKDAGDRASTVTECCPHCESEVEMRWDTGTMGFKAFCPVCGKRLMLCDECRHAGCDSRHCNACDYDAETDSCQHNPEREKEMATPPQIVRLCESVFDIALMAQHLCEQKRIVCDDSRELFATVLSLAQEFEAKFPDDNYGDDGDDYLDVIEKYAEGNLMGKYGIE